jgi:hypothetical protein
MVTNNFFVRCGSLTSLVTRRINDVNLEKLVLCTRLETLDVGYLSFDFMKRISAMSELKNLELNMFYLTSDAFVDVFQGIFFNLKLGVRDVYSKSRKPRKLIVRTDNPIKDVQ